MGANCFEFSSHIGAPRGDLEPRQFIREQAFGWFMLVTGGEGGREKGRRIIYAGYGLFSPSRFQKND